MSSECFDKTSRDPIDKAAALMFSKGQKLPPLARCSRSHSFHTSMPPTRKRRVHPDSKINPAFIDLTGVRFGRMTVLGLNADRRGKRGEAIWNCRCACGAHEIRKSKAIKNPENRGDRCTACRAIAQARHSHAFRTTGRGLDVRDI